MERSCWGGCEGRGVAAVMVMAVAQPPRQVTPLSYWRFPAAAGAAALAAAAEVLSGLALHPVMDVVLPSLLLLPPPPLAEVPPAHALATARR